MKNLLIFAFAGLILLLGSCQKTENRITPSSVNFSSERLALIDTLVNESIEKKCISGAVAYIARDGKVIYYKAFGKNDSVDLEKDAIFRIASQTKAITSAAVMILFQEGKFLLDDPVSKYIPEFADPMVVDTYNAKDTTFTLRPAKREITIRDLLTHTSGIDYPGIGTPNMTAIYAKNDIPVGFEDRPILLADAMKKLAKLPLAHDPGAQWTYGLNCDVLGYLIEVISGISFNDFLKKRIFEPLGMEDTYFYIPKDKQNRLVKLYTENEKHESVKWNAAALPGINADYPLVEGTYYSGGAGLSSPIADYAKFMQMMLDKGEFQGKRILAERTVELMITNQIGDISMGPNKFGLGFALTTRAGEAILGVSEGSFSWGGFFGTQYWADPREDLVCLLYCQQVPLTYGEIQDKFKVLVYSALDD